MCTSFVFNGKKTLVGWNFDTAVWKYQIIANPNCFYIALLVDGYFLEPMMGVNSRGDFVNCPWMNPEEKKGSFHKGEDYYRLDFLNQDLLFKRRTFEETAAFLDKKIIVNAPNASLHCQDTNRKGDALLIEPGIGHRLLKHPAFSVMSNFQNFREETSRQHPWAGYDRYQKVKDALAKASLSFDVSNAFEVLFLARQTQLASPTVLSIVYDASQNKVYWVEKQNFKDVHHFSLKETD